MDLRELQQILTNGEDSKHQFKREITHLDSLAAELVAFANNDGGRIFIGVNDNGLNKPYMDLQGRTWVKNGSDKRHVTAREEMQRMFLNARLIQADTVPVTGSTLNDLDEKLFNDYFHKRYSYDNEGKIVAEKYQEKDQKQ